MRWKQERRRMIFIAVAVKMLRMLEGMGRERVQEGVGVMPMLVRNEDETIRLMLGEEGCRWV